MTEWVGNHEQVLFNNKKPIKWIPPSWWKDRIEADISLEQLKELYDSNINVMMAHSYDENNEYQSIKSIT